MTGTIEKRLRHLEALEAIRTCIYSYAVAGDRRNDPALARSLFTPDSSYTIPGMFAFAGRDAILEGLAGVARDVVLFAFHHPGGPIIQIDGSGTTAKAFWWVWIPVHIVIDGKQEPRLEAGHYNAELVETEEGWQFSELIFEPKFTMTIEGGWQSMQGDFRWLV